MYTQHWDEDAFIEYTNSLIQQGVISRGEKYLTENRPTNLYLHFLPFLQGMLYAGSETALTNGELQLVQSLADAFATAYARYEDFNKLELAKQQVDKTLTELKQTQVQLIQAEKMASLGELTAGIAHEIQNPLNFVNNFSEVNMELLVELNEEIKKGNYEEVKNIAQDVISNEEKINHHGKRADAIVKGMLQHSRSSTGAKELTNINALADEYLRLAYHGLRARDKSFNATIKTDFDENIGNINIISQEIGRVMLNLIMNAFYAVHAKANVKKADNFEPSVAVSTKKIEDIVEIRVADNGNGIPRKILDKIFQPFFTTKPTGEGTGLGLSLAYDIVKAHGGNIRVETVEGEGTTFILSLPIN
jgi:signal transduction histidine kinase